MDANNLINQNINGTYCILFKNVHSLDSEEIKEIFSKFGKIHNISTCGDKLFPFYFIKYVHLSEAQNAVEGLRNHQKIKLLEHRKSEKKQEKYKKSNNNQNKYFTHKKGNENTYKTNYIKENKTLNHSCKNDSALTHSQKDSDNINLDSIKENVLKIQTNNGSKYNDSLPALINKYNIHRDEVPNLSSQKDKNLTKNKVSKNVFDVAEEIIVGNVHPNFGAPYILHLLDQFEPIAISKMYFIPSTNIRYCHVYFKSSQDSIKIEKQFDHMDLLGQKLVVLRFSRLIEEAAI